MATDDKRIVVLVHGWSVRSTDTYGELPDRLEAEASRAANLRLDVRNLWLGKYVSFSDAVRVEDLSRGFQAALTRELGKELKAGRRFACITHSTGGPVVRDWWSRYYQQQPGAGICPMSHLVMLAPANFGSALAQLGKSRVGRIKAWFEGVEPGEGVLNWLELGSPEAWSLNTTWIQAPSVINGDSAVFPFVLTGQSIDRKLYDHVNSYTGELGSDGVVRVAAANLNASYVRLEQEVAPTDPAGGRPTLTPLRLMEARSSQRTALTLIPGRSHSGEDMGILRSIKHDDRPNPTVRAILDCLLVSDQDGYRRLCDRFDEQADAVREAERVEIERRLLLPDTVFIHDVHAMVVFRLVDDQGAIVSDFDLKLTARKGKQISPNYLPRGFIVDHQKNRRHPGTVTFYMNHDLMVGSEAIRNKKRGRPSIIREAVDPMESLGLQIFPRPDSGVVHYAPAELLARTEALKKYLKQDQTTLVDIVLHRVVRERVFRLTRDRRPTDFTKEVEGERIP
jgi:hypothetical protein